MALTGVKEGDAPGAGINQSEGNKVVSEHDGWLRGNPQALASLQRGLADSAAGRVGKRASYAEHADDVLQD